MNQAFVWFQSEDIVHRVMDKMWRIADAATWGEIDGRGGGKHARRSLTPSPDYIYHDQQRSYGTRGWTSEPRLRFHDATPANSSCHQPITYVWGITHSNARAIASVREYFIASITSALPLQMGSQSIRCGACDRFGSHRRSSSSIDASLKDEVALFGSFEANGTIADIIVSYMPLPDHPTYFGAQIGSHWRRNQQLAHQHARVHRRHILQQVGSLHADKYNVSHASSPHPCCLPYPPLHRALWYYSTIGILQSCNPN
jgi:hypothetical protein